MTASTGTLNQEAPLAFVIPQIFGRLYPLAGVMLFGTAIGAAVIATSLSFHSGSDLSASMVLDPSVPPAPHLSRASPFGALTRSPDLSAPVQMAAVQPQAAPSESSPPAWAARVAIAAAPPPVTTAAPAVPSAAAPLPPARVADAVPEVPMPPSRSHLLRPHVDSEPAEAPARVAPAHEAAPAVAAAVPSNSPPPDGRNFFQRLFNVPQQANVAGVPGVDRYTAVYDVQAHVVYMPNGERLEAHSGLGNLMDDPRHVDAKDRGALPPNTYDLTMREQIFHGVEALRLIPVGSGNMYGRTGLLAHSYMLGANGDSNGCVSFKNYPSFLQAFKEGQIKHLVVMAHVT